jgi:dihydroorotate dehydrogenase electron transfer subunit
MMQQSASATIEPGLPRAVRIRAIRRENARTRTYLLDGAVQAAPGQFVMAWLPGVDEKPFSLAGADPISLTVASIGPFSRALQALEPGDQIWLRGPLGRGYRLPAGPGHAALIGGGYGVAPLKFLAGRLRAAGHPVSLIIGARSADDVLLAGEVATLGATVWIATEDGSTGQKGLATDALPQAVAAVATAGLTVYACGPTGMLRAVAAICQQRGWPAQLSWEAQMRCAIGLCGSCELGEGWLACLDGPVFDFNPTQRASWE